MTFIIYFKNFLDSKMNLILILKVNAYLFFILVIYSFYEGILTNIIDEHQKIIKLNLNFCF